MKGLRHVFFDLDHTLWDYDRNAQETLTEIHENFELGEFVSAEKFIKIFYEVNGQLWHKFNNGLVDRDFIRDKRFVEVFDSAKISSQNAPQVSEYFMNTCSNKPHLIDDARNALNYLRPKYELHIITNGFEEVQPRKLKASGIAPYFKSVVTSESSGARKPAPGIFQYALDRVEASKDESIMIGDNPKTDIHGARAFGIKTILFDPSGRKRSMADYTIQSLNELIGIL